MDTLAYSVWNLYMTEYRYAMPMIFFPNVTPFGYDILSSLALAFKIHFGTQKLPTFT